MRASPHKQRERCQKTKKHETCRRNEQISNGIEMTMSNSRSQCGNRRSWCDGEEVAEARTTTPELFQPTRSSRDGVHAVMVSADPSCMKKSINVATDPQPAVCVIDERQHCTHGNVVREITRPVAETRYYPQVSRRARKVVLQRVLGGTAQDAGSSALESSRCRPGVICDEQNRRPYCRRQLRAPES